MEPLAPGTEDDDVHQPPAISKKTTEQERLLSIRSYLPGGEYGNVFELTYNNGSEHWYCKICKCPIMGRVFYHEGGKRHSNNMAMADRRPLGNLPEPPILIIESVPQDPDIATSIKVAPGEPVPPGFEGEIPKVAQIQDRLNSFRSGPLLGLEYLLEIQDYDHEKEPSYLCLLCGKKGDPRTVIAHMVSYNHLQGYLQRHFPKTYQALAPYVTRQYKKNWQNTMNKIAEAIETKYGQLVPHPVDAETFERKKDDLFQMVHLGPHFSEKSGITFEHLVDKEAITKLSSDEIVCAPQNYLKQKEKKRSPSPPVVQKPKKPKSAATAGRRRSLSSVSSISSSDLSEFDDKKDPKKREERLANRGMRKPLAIGRRRSRSRSPLRNRYSRRSPSPRRGGGRGELPRGRYDNNMPWNRPDYVRSKSDVSDKYRDDKLDDYKRLSKAIETDMEKVLKQHKLNPEKHPQYNDEWKVFWNKRFKELQSEGKDATKYDFKPEWILYWNEKIVELHKLDVKAKVDALRKRLGIIPEPVPISFKIGSKLKGDGSESTKPTSMASQPDQDHEVIVIDDDMPNNSPNRRRAHSPWEGDNLRRKQKLQRRLSLERVSSTEPSPPPRRRSRSPKNRRNRRSRSPEYRSRDRDLRSREKSWERDINYYRESRKDPILDPYKPPPVIRDVTRHPVDYTKPPITTSDPDINDGDVNIVSVLRILTALEDKLGSLGPKVIDMLAAALAMEKKEANSSESLLDNEVNCVFFETIKEKLKGALHAGLVGYNQEKAFKIAIRKIASLLHLVGLRKREANAKPDPVTVAGVGSVDKEAIAKQIATALILQGKTDVTQLELEQLIEAVVGMAEASKSSDKPMTTASFLQQLVSKPEPSVIVQKEEVKIEPAKESPAEISKEKDSMDGLSDSDLQTLLQNFKDLSPEEQTGLITYLKKLENREPERVEKLRKFVNTGEETSKETPVTAPPPPIQEACGRVSPFTMKLNSMDKSKKRPTSMFEDEDEFEDKPKIQQKETKAPSLKIDSDEEDYTYEDVFKAANKNVEEKNKIKGDNKKDEDVLNDAKALIANIMGSITAKTIPKNVDLDSAHPKPTYQTGFNQNPQINLNLLPHNAQQQGNNFPNNYLPGLSYQGTSQMVPRGAAPNRPNFMNQNVQYPMNNASYGTNFNNQQNYTGNYNYSNQFNQNSRFNNQQQQQQEQQPGPRGPYNNANNRGGGHFNSNMW